MNVKRLPIFIFTLSFFIFYFFSVMNAQTQIDIQGHRGCRGLLPENTIPAFIKAIDLGVNTLEMDVVITQDKKVVVSHEAFLNHEICRNAKGEDIKESEEKSYNI